MQREVLVRDEHLEAASIDGHELDRRQHGRLDDTILSCR